MSDTVRLERLGDGITVVTLNRPERLNALDHQLVHELHEALSVVHADRDCRAVILTGAGRGFCAGLDLSGDVRVPGTESLGHAQAAMATQQHVASLIPRLRATRQPVIAAVNGPAAGGGLALALGSDIRIASMSARFNAAFVRIGLSGCDVGVSWLLPRVVGTTAAFELMLTGRLIDADAALAIGLVSRVVPDSELLDVASSIAHEIIANTPFGVWMTKEVMWSQLEIGSLQAGIDLENRTQVLAGTTEDMREALLAFRERRSPEYVDR